MNISLLFEGILIGLTIGAVVGPIAILCIKQTVAHGIWAGLAVGFGAALADGLYGGIAAFGLTTLCDFLLKYQLFLHIFGGVYLLYLGYTTFFKVPNLSENIVTMENYSSLIVPTFFLTLTSPVTILTFVALFSNVSSYCMTYAAALVVTFGVFLGSMAWWIILSVAAHILRTKLHPEYLLQINRIAGLMLMLFGILMLLQPLMKHFQP